MEIGGMFSLGIWANNMQCYALFRYYVSNNCSYIIHQLVSSFLNWFELSVAVHTLVTIWPWSCSVFNDLLPWCLVLDNCAYELAMELEWNGLGTMFSLSCAAAQLIWKQFSTCGPQPSAWWFASIGYFSILQGYKHTTDQFWQFSMAQF